MRKRHRSLHQIWSLDLRKTQEAHIQQTRTLLPKKKSWCSVQLSSHRALRLRDMVSVSNKPENFNVSNKPSSSRFSIFRAEATTTKSSIAQKCRVMKPPSSQNGGQLMSPEWTFQDSRGPSFTASSSTANDFAKTQNRHIIPFVYWDDPLIDNLHFIWCFIQHWDLCPDKEGTVKNSNLSSIFFLSISSSI